MGYREETYIIDPEVEDDEQFIVEKEMESISLGNNKKEYEIIEEERPKSVYDEIYETAKEEGLVKEDEKPFGGEGTPKPEDVIHDFINQDRTEAAIQKEEEYIDKKVENTKKVMATRELLTGMTKRILTVNVPMAIDVKQPDGSVKLEVCDVEFKIRRLTEAQSNHIFNRRMLGKTVDDMTPEELQEDNHFRSKFLSEAVVEPKLTAEEWYNTSAIVLGTVFNRVNEVLSSVDNTDLFQ